MFSLRQLCPEGEQTGDCLVYNVQSKSRAKVKHRVDLAAWSGFGHCSCEDFEYRVGPLLRAGVLPKEELECPHIKAARRMLAIEAAQAIIRKRRNESDENKAENGHSKGVYSKESPEY